MKYIKYILISLCLILVTGCNTNQKVEKKETVSKEKTTYLNYIKELKKVDESTEEEIPFSIEVKFDKLTDEEVRFQVILDNPTEEIKDISAVAVHNKPTEDVFPSTGIFEKKQSLIPNKKPTGIILVGYIPYEGKIENFECNMKVLVKYSQNNQTKKVYYVTKRKKEVEDTK